MKLSEWRQRIESLSAFVRANATSPCLRHARGFIQRFLSAFDPRLFLDDCLASGADVGVPTLQSDLIAAGRADDIFDMSAVAAGNIFDFLLGKDFYFIRHFYTLLFLRLIFYLPVFGYRYNRANHINCQSAPVRFQRSSGSETKIIRLLRCNEDVKVFLYVHPLSPSRRRLYTGAGREGHFYNFPLYSFKSPIKEL